MATYIKANCPSCGDVELAPTAVHLFVFPDAPQRNYYRFSCPRCATAVDRHANAEVVQALDGVVERSCVQVPAEALEPRTYAHPITADEVLDLILLFRYL